MTAVLPRDFGKPRPALVVQANAFRALPTVSLLPLTSELHQEHLVRIYLEPDASNGLSAPSQIQIDKVMTVRRSKIGGRIGAVDEATMERVDEAISRFLGLA